MTKNQQPEGEKTMLTKRFLGALLITAVVATSALAGDCRSVKGIESVVNNGNGTTSGAITEGGKLNGTTQTVFTSGFTPTPDLSTFSFTDELTLTTNNGVLRTHNVTLFDVVNGVFAALARIDPNTSTGNFAGATGVLYIGGRTTDGGASFQGEIMGSMCFAIEHASKDIE
jgi:hypothetical protein